MARPRLDARPLRQQVTLCLRPGEDDDLIAYLEQARAGGIPLAQAIIVAMRGGVATAVATTTADDDEMADDLLELVF